MNNRQIINVDKTDSRRFEQLTEAEKVSVLEKKKSFNWKDSAEVIQFGASDASDLSKFTGELFKNFKVSDFNDFESIITELLGHLSEVNPETLMKVEKSKWESVPIIGHFVKNKVIDRVNEVITSHTSVEKFILNVSTSLERTKYSVMKDMTLSNEMKEKCYEYAKKLEENFIVLQLCLEEARDEENSLMATADEKNLEDMSKVSDISNAVRSLERKQIAIASYRLIALQSVPKLTFLHNAAWEIATKLDDIKYNVLPQWRQQFGLAIFSFHIRNAAYVLESVRKATEEIYRQNGQLFSDALKYTANEIEAIPISMAALTEVNNNLISLCTELSNIETRAREEREKVIPEIQKMQQQILSLEVSSV